MLIDYPSLGRGVNTELLSEQVYVPPLKRGGHIPRLLRVNKKKSHNPL